MERIHVQNQMTADVVGHLCSISGQQNKIWEMAVVSLPKRLSC